MKYDKEKSSFRLWLYVDQVYTGIAQPLVDAMNKNADEIYCFTKSWAETYKAYGEGPTPKILEHGLDVSDFTCMSREQRMALRATVKIPADAIVFLNANRNSQRKRLDLMIMGFVKLLQNPDADNVYLMVVTAMNPQQGAFYDIQRVYLSELTLAGLDHADYAKRLMIIDTAPPKTLTDAQINEIYNMTDIGINTSDGEGFGLCQLEHLYTGAPQVVTKVGSYDSFLDSNVATFIPPSGLQYFAGSMPLGFSAPIFSREDIGAAMLDAVKNVTKRREAIKKFPFKSWSTVCDSWLEDLHAEE